ncbi:heme-degrading domain-containing protein [Streptomyces sp. Isolate_219]|uniref:heme-degrading domain-containing protein n=1 Tax=Streptomyces sp. Isolate_219 TaxID=2950110 RepID=UPI0021C5B6B8|nr:heme-degrading domain-containing protein [Streptomyces sp. Isolate_219]MCR8575575.1 heme-degrading domain-containing protein [Streptomyces sp. Isolate_219]
MSPAGPDRGTRTSPAGPRPADDDEIRELAAQEERLVLDTFSNDDAWQLGKLLVELAQERGAAVTIGIRRGAQQLFHCALPGTSADNDAWIARKSAVVERYAESSYLVGARFRAKGRTFEESSRLDADRYAAHGGAFPLRLRGTGVVGVVAVSGLPQADDHALVVEALERYLAAG